MKTQYFKLVILGVALLAISCQQEVPEQLTIIEGTFTNATTKEALFWGHLKAPGLLELDANSSFIDTLDIDADGYFIISVEMDDFPLFIKKGSATSFTVDLESAKPSLQITGGSQDIVDYLAKKRRKVFGTYNNVPEFYGKEPAAFKQQIDSVVTSLKSDLSNLTADASFKTLEEQSLKMDEISFYNQYPRYYKYTHKLDVFEAPAAFKDMFNNLDKDNEMYASNFLTYRGMITDEVMNDAYEKGGDDRLIEEIIEILKEKKSPSLRDNIIQSAMHQFIPKGNSVKIKDEFLHLASTDETKKVLQDRFDKTENLMKGKSSPTFNYENFKGGNTKLEDYKGKYVYIDVWATWCAPCIAEIPSLKELEHDYEDKNIEFVSISLDDKEAYKNWRKMVTDKALGGSQLIADNDFESKFVKDYAIRSIPRFILLDPEGNIVSADAPRPSNEKLTATFSKLGIK